MNSELDELGGNVGRIPREVADRAVPLIAAARAAGDRPTAALLATTLARARRNLGEYNLAERAIDDALELADGIGGDVLADAHLAAASIASFRQNASRAAFHHDEADRHGSPAIRLDVSIQRAVIAEREGRFDEALGVYDAVLAGSRGETGAVVRGQILGNRGKLNVLRGYPSRALSDFAAARELFEREGQVFAVILAIENAAWAKTTMGDIPGALAMLEDAAALGCAQDHRLQQATVSRAEALMSVGLFVDAFDALAGAVTARRVEGDSAGLAIALLLQAEASRMAQLAGGAALAGEARDLFHGLGAKGWEHQAQLEVLRSAHRRDHDSTTLEDAERLAVELTGGGQARAEVDAWNLVTEVAVSLGAIERAEHAATRCAERAATIPFVEHRLAAAHAVALVHAASGQVERALDEVVGILDEYDNYRKAIASPDARSASALHASSLCALGGTLVASTGNASRMLGWTEQRRRSVTIWDAGAMAGRQHPGSSGRSPSHRDLDRDPAAELQTVLSALRRAEAEGGTPGRDLVELHARRAELELELRDALLRSGEVGSSLDERHPVRVEDLDGHTGVSIDFYGDRLRAIVVEDGEMRVVDLGDTTQTAAAAADTVSRLLARAAQLQAAGRSQPTGHRQLIDSIAVLERLVVEPLELGPGPVVLALPASLHHAPLWATPGMYERPIALVPSLGWWASRSRHRPHGFDRVVAVAGPRLLWSDTEVRAVTAAHQGATMFTGDEATADAVGEAFATASLVHVAAHTRLRRDNPMWSTIELADGPLPLHRVAHRPITNSPIVVLSTCESALAAGAPGAMMPGFAAALLDIGARGIVASISKLPDHPSTCAAIEALHRGLADGLGIGAALARVRIADPESIAAISLTAWGGD